MALAPDAVEQGVDLLVGQGVAAPPLGVEVGAILGHLGQGVVDLVVEKPATRSGAEVLDRDPGALAERHLPVAVESAGRVDRDRAAS